MYTSDICQEDMDVLHSDLNVQPDSKIGSRKNERHSHLLFMASVSPCIGRQTDHAQHGGLFRY